MTDVDATVAELKEYLSCFRPVDRTEGFLAGVDVWSYLRYGISQPERRSYGVVMLAHEPDCLTALRWDRKRELVREMLDARFPGLVDGIYVRTPRYLAQHLMLLEAAQAARAALGPELPPLELDVSVGEEYSSSQTTPIVGLTFARRDEVPGPAEKERITEVFRAHAEAHGFAMAAKLVVGLFSVEEEREYVEPMQPNAPITYTHHRSAEEELPWKLREVLGSFAATPAAKEALVDGVDLFTFLTGSVEGPARRMYHLALLSEKLPSPMGQRWLDMMEEVRKLLKAELPKVLSYWLWAFTRFQFAQLRILTQAAIAARAALGIELPPVDISVPSSEAWGQGGSSPRIDFTYARPEERPGPTREAKVLETIRALAIERGYDEKLAAKIVLGFVSVQEIEEYNNAIVPNWNGFNP